MGLRFRTSIKLGPGVRLNLGKKSASMSFGGKAGRYTVSTTGRRTTSVNLPGGLSYVSSTSGRGRSTRQPSRAIPPPTTPAPAPAGTAGLPKPGLFASGAEKRYYEGAQAYMAGDLERALRAFQAASASDQRNVSDDFFAGLSASNLGLTDLAMPYLERVVQSDIELPDELQRKYLPPDRVQVRVSVAITDKVRAAVAFDSLGATLLLAECYQESGRREEAIGLVQQLIEAGERSPELRLSLADLLFDDEDFEGVVEVTAAAENDSDVGLAALHLKAMALAILGMRDASLKTFNDCLRRTSGRDAALLQEIRYDRATFLESIGEHQRARKDWEKLYADDPKFRDVARRATSN